MEVDDKDPWDVLGGTVKVLGRWWSNRMSKADRKYPWPCQLAHFSSCYVWPDGEVSPTYFIESQGHLYPMRAADVTVPCELSTLQQAQMGQTTSAEQQNSKSGDVPRPLIES